MNKFILLLLASIGLALICGCDGSVSQVKNGTLGGHPDVTVGAAFDGSFDSTKWSTITDKGRKIVSFTGKIKQATHDTAVKNIRIDEITFCQQYKADEFKKRFAPFDKKVTTFNNTTGKELEDAKYNSDKIKWKYDQLGRDQNTAEQNYSLEETQQNKKVIDDIKHNKELLEKEFSALENKIALLNEKEEQMNKEKIAAIDKIQKEMIEEFKINSCWPVGSMVKFDFTVYPDGKKFDISSFSNDSWNELGTDLNTVLKVIFAK